MSNKVGTVNEFDENRYRNFVEMYLNDGYILQSTSCQPDADGITVWAAVLVLEGEKE